MLDKDRFKSKEILAQILSLNSGKDQLNVAEMRKRIKVLDKIEMATDELTLEDSEYNTLRPLVEGFNFSVAHKDLLAVLDAVLDAKDG
jgi:hypothetical protein